MKYLLIALSLSTSAFAQSLTLVNDSNYPLTVSIYDVHATELDSFDIPPLQEKDWTNLDQSTNEKTTYTVSWGCADGTSFSNCVNVLEGSSVSAKSCTGSLRCGPNNSQQFPSITSQNP